MRKTVRLGTRLRYPVTVRKFLKSPGDKVQAQEPVFEYSYTYKREVKDKIKDEPAWEDVQATVTWNSPSEGELKSWNIREGQVIERDGPCMAVEEACSHEIQFHGLCAMCGKDMTVANWAAESRDTDRATISMVHDQTNLTVSESFARKTEKELQNRLLKTRRLSLVVDLDQTIIQACIDPTVGEWMKDPSNPNYDSVKDIKTFQLDDGPSWLSRRCWYYIKMRPGLEDFLKRMATMYEMHVYTMGTRAYAQSVAHAVDPDKKLFGNRVISRDENGSIHAKSLQRLFPVSTNMVVIIDDRSDVWPYNRPNLIKVSPYEFFKGIGDINASFLPKRQDLLPSRSSGTTNGVAKKDKTVGAAASRAASEGEITQEQLAEQASELEKQIKERPLQALQEKLDREDEEAEKATVQSEDGSESRSSSPVPQRHRVLYDDDTELEFLDKHLTKLHQEFYDAYDKQKAQKQDDDEEVPDVGQILDNIKSQVFKGHKITLSGVIRTDIDIYQSDIGQQILAFGGELRTSVTKDLTVLVVNTMRQPGWTKLRAARRLPNCKIVGLEWLVECFARWECVDMEPYLYKGDGDKHLLPSQPGGEGEESGASDEGDEDLNGANGAGPKTPANKKRPGLRITAAARDDVDTDIGEEDRDLMPDDLEDGQMSPIDGLKTFNWGSAEEELNEFLASVSSEDEDDEDDEDEDMDEEDDDEDDQFVPKEEVSSSSEDLATKRRSRSRTASPRRSASPANRKRKHDANEDAADAGTESEGTGKSENESPSKKLRRTKSARGSSLRNQFAVSSGGTVSSSSLPTPAVTGDEEDVALLKEDGEDDGDGWDEAELEAEFMAEFASAEEQMEREEREASIAAGMGEREKG